MCLGKSARKNACAGVNEYMYNGKELNEDLGLNWLDYGARYYDPSIGRFTGVDPISDQFPHVTTYNYAENEPIGHIDLHGLQKVKPPLLQRAAQWLGIDMEAGASNLDQPQTSDQAQTIERRRGAVGKLASDLEKVRDLQEETIPGAKMIRLAHEGDVGGMVEAGIEETVGYVIGGIVIAKILGKVVKWARKVRVGSDEGVIYRINDKTKTPSGKPYVGSADDLDNRARTATDGRDRSGAEVIGKYKKSNKRQRRVEEQKGINRSGGKDKLDNKRDEITKSKWKRWGIKPPKN